MERAGLGELGFSSRAEGAAFLKRLWRGEKTDCPLCGRELEPLHRKAKKSDCDWQCRACGKVRTLDAHYRFEDGLTIAAYYGRIKDIERETLLKEPLHAQVKTTIFPEQGRKRRERGECTLDASGLSYRSETASFTIPFAELPALPFSCGTEFETYHNDELYYFYPTENPRQAARWALLVDLIKETRDEENQE